MKLKLENIDPDREYEEWVEFFHRWIFDQDDREILRRHYLDGVPYGALAEEFCIDVDTVRSRMRKARKKLFKHI